MDIRGINRRQEQFFEPHQTKALDFRLDALDRLKKEILTREKQLLDALKKDLNKSAYEGYLTELGLVLSAISHAHKNLPKWVKRKRKWTPITSPFSRSFVSPEPYGRVLIIAPWNYPLYLCLSPLVGAIAAGNCAVLKPSERASNSANAIHELIQAVFSPEHVAVVQGAGSEIGSKLLQEKFDYIFYTGSERVGKLVMEAASHNLTPVTLELGGKNPCIVEKSADLDSAAKRIAHGKFLNSGQTCIAPDYLLVQEDCKDELLGKIKKYIDKLWGPNPLENEDYPKLINEGHFSRVIKLMEQGDIIFGGKADNERFKISPTILDPIDLDVPVMQEEIFGPVLPVISFETLDDAINLVRKYPKPLALYLFTKDKRVEDNVLERISFGGGCINDTVIHVTNHYMAFGGVGNSGMGNANGKSSFDTFSNYRGIMKTCSKFDVALRYPPYREKSLKVIKKILK